MYQSSREINAYIWSKENFHYH